MDPKNQPQFNPKIPLSEVLKQEQTGYVPSAPKIGDVVSAISNMYESTREPGMIAPVSGTTPNTPADKTQINTTPVTSANPAPTSGAVVPAVSQIKIIKTYRSDAAEAVKTQQQSVVKIAIAEDERRRERGDTIAGIPRKRAWLLPAAIGLIALGAVAIPTVQYILNQKKQGVSVVVEKTIIPFDHQENVLLDNITRDSLIGELDILEAKSPVGAAIKYRKIFEVVEDANGKTSNKKITPDIFAGLIGPNMPSALARSFDSDYMYGVENPTDPKPFILFKTSSYQQTFANMLRWETKMIIDLSPILNLGTNAISHSFADQIVTNKEVRAITAPDGNIVFLYGFLDNQTLLIATDPQTFQDINNRYIATRFVQ